MIFDQHLRTAQLPVFEYSLHGNILRYRLANCIPRLSLPLKTNLTKDEWLQATDSWQELKLSAPLVQDSLKVDPDFFAGVKMVD